MVFQNFWKTLISCFGFLVMSALAFKALHASLRVWDGWLGSPPVRHHCTTWRSAKQQNTLPLTLSNTSNYQYSPETLRNNRWKNYFGYKYWNKEFFLLMSIDRTERKYSGLLWIRFHAVFPTPLMCHKNSHNVQFSFQWLVWYGKSKYVKQSDTGYKHTVCLKATYHHNCPIHELHVDTLSLKSVNYVDSVE